MHNWIFPWDSVGFTVMPTQETHYGTATARCWVTGMKSAPDHESLTSSTPIKEHGSADPRPNATHSTWHTVTTSPGGQASQSFERCETCIPSVRTFGWLRQGTSRPQPNWASGSTHSKVARSTRRGTFVSVNDNRLASVEPRFGE